MGQKAIILLSGGLDSTVMLASALGNGRKCFAISFDYNQRHRVELEAAKAVAAYYQIPHRMIVIDPTYFTASSLVNQDPVMQGRTPEQINNSGIPNTYVPARNTLFLAYAVGFAEMMQAEEIYFGANVLDQSPYPDTRPEYFQAFQALIKFATKQAIQGVIPQIMTPFIGMDKRQIIWEGKKWKAPLELTFSCYNPNQARPCGVCDACVLRNEGFANADKLTIS